VDLREKGEKKEKGTILAVASSSLSSLSPISCARRRVGESKEEEREKDIVSPCSHNNFLMG